MRRIGRVRVLSPAGLFPADMDVPVAGHGADGVFWTFRGLLSGREGEKTRFFSRNRAPAGEKHRKLIDDN